MEIKEQFLKWIDSKGVYEGYPYESYIKKFVEFLDFNPFILNDDYSNILEAICKIENKKKELNNNELYNDFNRKSGSKVPDAIFGSKNYFSFLKELHFNYTVNAVNDELVADKSMTGVLSFTNKRDKNWIFIEDIYGLIGSFNCHYELRLELKTNMYSIEVHFEGNKDNYNNFLPFLNTFPILNKDESQNNNGLWKRKKNKKFCIRSGSEYLIGTPNLVKILKDNLVYLEKSIGDKLREIIDPSFESSTNNIKASQTNKIEIKQMNHPLNQILFGPPGTGKTYNTINEALKIVDPGFYAANKENRDSLTKRYKELLINDWSSNSGQIAFCTFHQSFSYEDFVEGIKPITKDDSLIYDIEDGIFKRICRVAQQKEITKNNFDQAYLSLLNEIKENGNLVLETLIHSKEFTIYENTKGNLKFHANTEKAYEAVLKKNVIEHYLKTGDAIDWPSYVKSVGKYLIDNHGYNQEAIFEEKQFVLIIDEINRGNVSSIFGELITLIEDDKRIDTDEELRVILPYSKELFGVPKNVHIIGTMNTADRSIEALDTALRRRFAFKEMPPKVELIKTSGSLKNTEGVLDELDLVKMLKVINKRIERLIDKDHRIGHAYFLKVATKADLVKAFRNKVIPLLEEYFFGDFGKIGLVLGNSFVEKVNDDFEFAAFKEYDSNIIDDLKNRCVYGIRQSHDWDFKSIYATSKNVEQENKVLQDA